METLINGCNFVTAKSTERVAFMGDFDKVAHTDDVGHTEDELRSALKAVAVQVGQENFPSDLSDGVYMANHAIRLIHDQAE